MRFSLILSLFLTALALRANAAPNDRHVLLITLDGFPAYLFRDPKAPIPTLRKLASEGVSAEGMRAANPTITWPNHTTLVTGVYADKHSVLFNGLLKRNDDGKPLSIDAGVDQSQLIAVPTIWDVAHNAGFVTAAINWPCTRNAKTLDYNFPDVADQIEHITPIGLKNELAQLHLIPGYTQASWGELSAPQRDWSWTQSACYVIRQHKPNLLLLHMLLMDTMHHQYGPQSTAGYAAAAVLDSQLKDVLQALDEAGIRQKTTIFVVADHGFAISKRIIQPNVILRKLGLLKVGAARVMSSQVQAAAEGGIAIVYFLDPSMGNDVRDNVIKTFTQMQGVAEIIKPDRFGALGLPVRDMNHQMGDLVLVAKEGFAFGDGLAGESVIEATPGAGNIGNHGYLNTDEKMNALFVASGRGIRKGLRLPIVDNRTVAPTIARILGLQLDRADAKPLEPILDPAAFGHE